MKPDYDLSILIPARNEEFLSRTVQDIIENKRGKTEILVGLDGEWASPPIEDHVDVTVVYYPESIGQREMTNQLCRLSLAKYVMKLDAHCSVDEGFDIKLLQEMKDDWTMVPIMRNLHAFDWLCPDGHRRYQGPSGPCKECGKETVKDILWRAKPSPQSKSYCFDSEPHFQYFGEYCKRPEHKKDLEETGLTETMSLQGSCFVMTRDKYWELDVCDNSFGSWGSQGIEVAVKTWLSGGRVVVNHKTWYAHMFRTQGGDFGFPYPQSGKQVHRAKKYAKDLFFENKWPKQVKPLSWLIERFWPVKGWEQKDLTEIKKFDGMVKDYNKDIKDIKEGSKGMIFYTDNKLNLKIARAVQKNLNKISAEKHIPIVSVSLKPMNNMGRNIHLPLKSGCLTMFQQILTALEASSSEIIYFCEHDVLYHSSHFDFIPPQKDLFYYNTNWWKVWPDGLVAHWDANQVSGLCGYRDHLIDYYRNRIREIKEKGFNRSYEPGGRDKSKYETWKSELPIIDIRHPSNLSRSHRKIEDFRDKSTATNFETITIDQIPGWDLTIEGIYDK